MTTTTKPRRKRDGRRNNGRPSTGLAEVVLGIRVPLAVRDAMSESARTHGVSTNEAWRRAARVWLGLGEVSAPE